MAGFLRDRRGTIATLYALMFIPMMGAVALALDFGAIMVDRTKAQMAADAAALQASGTALGRLLDSDGGPSITSLALSEGKSRGEALFKAHANQSGLGNWTATTTVVRQGQDIKATTTFSVTRRNNLGALFGMPTFTTTGDAETKSTLPDFVDVYFALDQSPSMGIAATQGEMNALFDKTVPLKSGGNGKVGCVFGCHTVADWLAASETPVQNTAQIAKASNIRLRIDILRAAVVATITRAASQATGSSRFRLSLNRFGLNPTPNMEETHPLSNNFQTLAATAQAIDMGIGANAPPSSYLNEAVGQLAGRISAAGDGSSRASSKKFALIVTDGVRDVQVPSTGCTPNPGAPLKYCIGPIDPNVCAGMKAKGVTVGIIYTTYIPITGYLDQHDAYRGALIDTNTEPRVRPALQACASPGWFFEAADADSIKASMDKMFAQVLVGPTLTN